MRAYPSPIVVCPFSTFEPPTVCACMRTRTGEQEGRGAWPYALAAWLAPILSHSCPDLNSKQVPLSHSRRGSGLHPGPLLKNKNLLAQIRDEEASVVPPRLAERPRGPPLPTHSARYRAHPPRAIRRTSVRRSPAERGVGWVQPTTLPASSAWWRSADAARGLHLGCAHLPLAGGWPTTPA